MYNNISIEELRKIWEDLETYKSPPNPWDNVYMSEEMNKEIDRLVLEKWSQH